MFWLKKKIRELETKEEQYIRRFEEVERKLFNIEYVELQKEAKSKGLVCKDLSTTIYMNPDCSCDIRPRESNKFNVLMWDNIVLYKVSYKTAKDFIKSYNKPKEKSKKK